jgi:hypothetical protein
MDSNALAIKRRTGHPAISILRNGKHSYPRLEGIWTTMLSSNDLLSVPERQVETKPARLNLETTTSILGFL